MTTRLLITGAGTGAGNNLVRSLRAGHPSLYIAGCHHDRFALGQAETDRKFLIPTVAQPGFVDGIRRVVETERIDLVVPTADAEVRAVARARERIHRRAFLPRPATIVLCQDKYRLTRFLQARGVPVPATAAVTDLRTLDASCRRLAARQSLVWCRVRRGQGAAGAIPVTSAEQARSWIRYWQAMRGVPATLFTLSEYLPGRDFGCQSLWKEGRLALIKTFERLSYVTSGSQPSRVSSIAAVAKTVREPRVAAVCAEAIRRLDPRASGIFCVDLKENADGVPCVTEINAGRFSMSTTLYDTAGAHNMAATYVRLALGDRIDVAEPYDVAEGYYMVRDLDNIPSVVHADQLFDGIVDARGAHHPPGRGNGPHERRRRDGTLPSTGARPKTANRPRDPRA